MVPTARLAEPTSAHCISSTRPRRWRDQKMRQCHLTVRTDGRRGLEGALVTSGLVVCQSFLILGFTLMMRYVVIAQENFAAKRRLRHAKRARFSPMRSRKSDEFRMPM